MCVVIKRSICKSKPYSSTQNFQVRSYRDSRSFLQKMQYSSKDIFIWSLELLLAECVCGLSYKCKIFDSVKKSVLTKILREEEKLVRLKLKQICVEI